MTTTTEADRALKARHKAMWAMGDYPTVATGLVPELGTVLVGACRIGPRDRVLDVAAGTGNASIPAALTGATVTATDLTPELLAVGERLAEQQGAKLVWAEADAENLPFSDGEFDTVMSCLGVMFAPHHQASADELVRVCRRGGTIGLLNWTPEGFVGQLFATMKPYAAPPPPGAQPAPLWGDEAHVRALLGDRVGDITVERRTLRVDQFRTGDAFREYFKRNYGPVAATYRLHADDPQRTAALDRDLDELAKRFDLGDRVMAWEYLLLTARRR